MIIDIIKIKEEVIKSNKDWHKTYITWKAVVDLLLNNDITEVTIYTDDKDLQIEWVTNYIYELETSQDDVITHDISIYNILYDWEAFIDIHWWQEDIKNKKIRYMFNHIDWEVILKLLYYTLALNNGKFGEDMWTISSETMDKIIGSTLHLRNENKDYLEEWARIAFLGWNAMADAIQFLSNFGLLEELLWVINKQNYIQHNFDDYPEWMKDDWLNRVLSSKINILREYNWNDIDIIFAILFYDIAKPFYYTFERKWEWAEEQVYHNYNFYWDKNVSVLEEIYPNFNSPRVKELISMPLHNINYIYMEHIDITKDIYDIWYAIAKAKLCENNAPVKTFLINEWLEWGYKENLQKWIDEWEKLAKKEQKD